MGRADGQQPEHPRVLPWLPRWPVALWAATITVLLVMVGRPEYPLVTGPLFLLVSVVGTVVTVRAGWQRGVAREQRRPWQIYSPTWALTILLAMAYGMGLASDPPNVALLWVGALTSVLVVAVIFVALLSFPRHRMGRTENVRFWLDMTTVAAGAFMVLWYVVLGPLVATSPDPVMLLSATQPALYVVLVFAVAAVMMRGAVDGPRHPLSFLLAGTMLTLVGQLLITHAMRTFGEVRDTLPTDLALLSGSYLTILAATVQRRRARSTTDNRRAAPLLRRPSVVPYSALVVGYAILLLAAWETQPHPLVALVLGAGGMTAAVAVRQALAQRENHQLLVRDALTGLASRVHFSDLLQSTTTAHTRAGRGLALLVIDLDGFKRVNDTLGHAAGDSLLVQFADALRRAVRETDVAARVGGDEFSVLLPDVEDVQLARTVADRVHAACSAPFEVAGSEVAVRASIGIALSTAERPCSVDDLLQHADAAMYQAKRAGTGGVRVHGEPPRREQAEAVPSQGGPDHVLAG